LIGHGLNLGVLARLGLCRAVQAKKSWNLTVAAALTAQPKGFRRQREHD